jgi:NADPH:quinone reductase-like Zn-dependent oxidoreductase
MRAIEFSMFGDPAEVLELVSIPQPAPGPGEALVRMTARPINPSDLYMVRGQYGYLPSVPAVPGLEGCGVIEAVGQEVEGYRVGQRVVPFMIDNPGSWSEYVVVPATPQGLVPVPDALGDDKAAQFTVNPLSAWLMMRYRLRLVKDDWLVQTAGASQVGRVVHKLAATEGIHVISIVHRPQRAAELLDQGAEHVLCSATDNVYAEIMARTDGVGATAALDAVGGTVATDVARALRRGGQLLIYGLLGGKATTFDTSALLFNGNAIEGFWLSAAQRKDPAGYGEAAAELAAYPHLPDLISGAEASYDLARFGEAVRHAERSGRSGKILLTG